MNYLEQAKHVILEWFAKQGAKSGWAMRDNNQIHLKISIRNPKVSDKFEDAMQSLIEEGYLALKENTMVVLTDLGYNSDEYTRILENLY